VDGDRSDFSGFDEVVYAIGRSPAIEDLGLEHVPGVCVDAATNHIQNDAFSNTGAQVSVCNVLCLCLCVAKGSLISLFSLLPALLLLSML